MTAANLERVRFPLSRRPPEGRPLEPRQRKHQSILVENQLESRRPLLRCCCAQVEAAQSVQPIALNSASSSSRFKLLARVRLLNLRARVLKFETSIIVDGSFSVDGWKASVCKYLTADNLHSASTVENIRQERIRTPVSHRM